MEVYQEAQKLSQGQKPDASFTDQQRKRQVQLWGVQDLDFSKEYGQPVRVVRSQEQWGEKRFRGGRLEQQPQCSQWVWAASAELDGYATEVVYEVGHRRWGIENKAFNELTQGYHPGTLLPPRSHLDVGADVDFGVGLYAVYSFCPPQPMGSPGAINPQGHGQPPFRDCCWRSSPLVFGRKGLTIWERRAAHRLPRRTLCNILV